MGRTKIKELVVKTGTLYFFDKRWEDVTLFKRVLSRQYSKNVSPENRIIIRLKPNSPSCLVCECQKFFGKVYVKVLVTVSADTFHTGWLLHSDLLLFIKGNAILEESNLP